MNPQEIVTHLQARFGPVLTAALATDKHPRVHTTAEHWRAVAEHLRHDPALRMDWLANLTGIDYAADEQMAVAYDLWSSEHKHTFCVKVYCPRERASVPSVVDLWAAADWHERETFDLLGIDFPGHPDLRRILLADDWEGFPLRKDYQFPTEYHGIPANVDTKELIKQAPVEK